MGRVPDLDEAMEDPYEIPIKYIEEDEWEPADLDGWPEDFFHEEIKAHPPEHFRDKGNGEQSGQHHIREAAVQLLYVYDDYDCE